MADYEPSAADVKALRERTGAGVLDCRAALKEAGGDLDKAVEVLRIRGQASAAKRSDRATGEGTVASFVHAGKVGVLVEVRCETDFVARGDDFQEFAREVALHIAARSGATPRSCLSSKTRAWDFRSPTTATSWKPDALCSAASPTT